MKRNTAASRTRSGEWVPMALLDRGELAEEVCRDLRRVLSMRDCDRTKDDWSVLLKRLHRWMKSAGARKFDPPKPLRATKKDGE